MAEAWKAFSLKEASYDTIARHGYYTELLKPGFRIVAINSNFCNDENFWILTTRGDPGHQNEWLVRTLYQAEIRNEKVALIGHIPPGGEDQIYACSKAFYDIINRFKHTVTSQFYGHTHWDHIKLFYDADETPSNIAYITPSLTTWVGMDPSFRVYEMDHWNRKNSTFAVLDHHTYTADVHIPKSQKMKFQLEYSARAAYQIESLSPKNFGKIIERWRSKSDGTFQAYFRHKYHNNLNQKCDQECKKQTLCFITSAYHKDC